MRIGVNTLFLIPGEVGGSETYLRETLRALAAATPGDELVLFTNRENDATLRADLAGVPGARFVPMALSARSRPARILAEQFALPRRAAREGLDALWSPGYTAPLAYRGPQAVSILDLQYKSHPDDLAFAARAATDALVRAAARRCGRILAISAFTRSEILKYTAARPERVAVTRLAADPIFARPAPSKGWTELVETHPSLGRPFLLCVAHSYPHKNLAALIRAFGALEAHIPHALVWVGGPRRGEAAAQAAARTLADPARLIRFERLPVETLAALYQHAAWFVFPSRYEGFGLPVLEAMTAGAPVLAARAAAIPEVGGDAIAYFDPDDPGDLERRLRAELGRSDAERAERIRSGRARAAEFSWAQTARETRAALAEFPARRN